MTEPGSTAIPSDDVAARRVGALVRGKWRIDALLGLGGMATVYAATHRNGQRAALKIMHQVFARDAEVVDRFLGEGYVANKIGHASCVRVLDDDVTEDGEPFLVMELLEGETVRDRWRHTGKRLPLADVLHIAERLLDCLSACHAAGVVHRDLKPANVYVTSAGDIKLLDFGVALLRDSGGAAAGQALGTPAYMAPEQAMGLADKIDHRVDIFSVGALIYALSSGRRVHRAKTEQEGLKLAATARAQSLAEVAPDMPSDVVALVDRALSFEPSERFPDAASMQRAVAEAAARLTNVASSPAPSSSQPDDDDDDHTPVQEVLSPDDPRAIAARDAIAALGEAINRACLLGRDDFATQAAVEKAAASVVMTVEREGSLVVTVRPAALLTSGLVAWAPTDGVERVPRDLFAAGVRVLRLTRGVSAADVRALCNALSFKTDLAANEDAAVLLASAALGGVRVESASSFSLGTARERDEIATEREALETLASAAQRWYAFRRADKSLRAPRHASAVAFDDALKAACLSLVDPPSRSLRQRQLDLIAAAILEAGKRGEIAPVLGALRKSAARAMDEHRLAAVLDAARGLAARLADAVGPTTAPKLEAAVMSAMFGKEALVSALANLDNQGKTALAPVLAKLGPGDFPTVASALALPMGEETARVLLASTEHVTKGKEADLVARAASSAPGVKSALRAWLLRAGHAALAETLPASLGSVAPKANPAPTPEDALLAALLAIVNAALAKQHATAAYERSVGDAALALARLPKGEGPIRLELASGVVFANGRLARVTHSGLEVAQELAAALGRAHAGRVIVLPRGASADDFRRFGVDVAAGSSASSIKTEPLSDTAKTRGLDVERLPLEQRVARAFASALLALRAILVSDVAAPNEATPELVRAMHALAALSEGLPPAFVALSHSMHDSDGAAHAISAALLSIAGAREVTGDVRVLAEVGLGAALAEAARPARVVSLGWADAERGLASVIAREATSKEERSPSFLSRIVRIARAFVASRAAAGDTMSLDETVSEIAGAFEADADLMALRAIVAGLGLVPVGTLVRLSSGEVGEVTASNEEDPQLPRVRITALASGAPASGRREIDLDNADGVRISAVMDVSGWKPGVRSAPASVRQPEATRSPTPEPGDARAAEDEASLKQHSFVRASSPAETETVAPTATGDLGTTPLVNVLVYMLDRALSGTIEVAESDGSVHRILFDRGAPKRVVTGKLIVPLGALLVTGGLLSDADAASAVRRATQAGVPLGKYLVDADLIARVDLLRALEVQVRKKVAALTNVPPGATYAFYKDLDRLEPSPTTETLSVDALDVLLEAARSWTDRDRVRATLSRFSQLPLVIHPESTIDLADLLPKERSVLGIIRETRPTLASLCERPPVDVGTIVSLVYLLVVTRQLALGGQTKGPLGVRPSSMRPNADEPRIVPSAPGPISQQPSPVSQRPSPVSQRPVSPAVRSSAVPEKAASDPPPFSSPEPGSGGRRRISLGELRSPTRRPTPKSISAPPKAPKVERKRSADMLRELARIEQALSRKDLKGAQRIAVKAQDLDDRDPDLLALLVWIRALLGEVKAPAAIGQLADLLKDAPDSIRARLFRAKLYKRENQIREAVADFEAVLADDPGNKDAVQELRLLALLRRT